MRVTSASAPRPVLLLIGGQGREVYRGVHRVELQPPPGAAGAGASAAFAGGFVPEPWAAVDATRAAVGGWAGHTATVWRSSAEWCVVVTITKQLRNRLNLT